MNLRFQLLSQPSRQACTRAKPREGAAGTKFGSGQGKCEERWLSCSELHTVAVGHINRDAFQPCLSHNYLKGIKKNTYDIDDFKEYTLRFGFARVCPCLCICNPNTPLGVVEPSSRRCATVGFFDVQRPMFHVGAEPAPKRLGPVSQCH